MAKMPFFKSIHLKFALMYVLLIVVAIQIISVYFIQQIEDRFKTSFKNSINDRIELLVYNIADELNKESENDPFETRANIEALVSNFPSVNISVREIQVIDRDGEVIVTKGNVGSGGERTNDARVKQALLGSRDDDILRDPSNGDRIYVLAMPIILDDKETVEGAIYVEASMEEVYQQLNEINTTLVTATVIALIITAFLGIILAKTITRPMLDMRSHALIMARGDFTRKVKVYGDDEIGQLASAFNDLTRKLQEANAITEGERKKLSSILSFMTDGVVATDSEGMIILMNDRAEQLLNISRQNVLGTSILKLLRLSDQMTWDELYNSPESLLLDFSDEEETYILRSSHSFIQKEDGSINGLIAVLHDITEQEQIEQERREFVVNVSHELRTPLTTLKSYIEALQEGAWEDKEIAPRFLKVVGDETDRMIRLVNDLLQLSKMDKKEYNFNLEEFDFIDYFHSVIDRFEMSKPEGIRFVRHLQNASAYVNIDKDKITQVIDNIISNAMKYSPEGGTITCRCWIQSKKLRVSISDEGVGIPKANISRIFERFYRVDRARTRQLGGTGLGLAIAKDMIHAHGGDIWAESEWGKGTTIYFTLPFRNASEADYR
ncbi:cell wall metabolism sensor histidine kinase WalK [Pueribacillus theae]|uniref:histidine kinase n=1 Tax=Pueribacillus theae TaxID=2171751 RepID=A0A2U1JNU0_9BACI|nr:cell wall metabolism sensor histidine kinase WalK [Pueribacillus theae]PWA06629.1 cell wall metabolism sensor histidine kinase WalK [Pueribacillus theae]